MRLTYLAHEMATTFESGFFDPVEDFKMLPFWIVAEILFGLWTLMKKTDFVTSSRSAKICSNTPS
jgi:hypothetical protein